MTCERILDRTSYTLADGTTISHVPVSFLCCLSRVGGLICVVETSSDTSKSGVPVKFDMTEPFFVGTGLTNLA
jgi:hypothetical protein